VKKAVGRKLGRWQQEQVSELFSMEVCEKEVMDFEVTMDMGKYPPQ
jgi:hypothetical protein